MSAGGGILSADERSVFLKALEEPMTDDEAVGLIAELVTLAAAVSKVASQEQQKALLPIMIRAGNMVPYIAARLAAAAELATAADNLAAGIEFRIDDARSVMLDRLRAAIVPFKTEPTP